VRSTIIVEFSPSFQSGINATLVSLFEKLQDLVAGTPTKIEDALAEEVERRVWLRINEASKPTLAMEIGEARAKILSQAAPAPLSDGLVDLS
jgi:hypothetical protein